MLKIVKTGAGFPADMYLFKINNGNTRSIKSIQN